MQIEAQHLRAGDRLTVENKLFRFAGHSSEDNGRCIVILERVADSPYFTKCSIKKDWLVDVDRPS